MFSRARFTPWFKTLRARVTAPCPCWLLDATKARSYVPCVAARSRTDHGANDLSFPLRQGFVWMQGHLAYGICQKGDHREVTCAHR